MTTPLNIEIKIMDPAIAGQLPQYETDGSAGMDLRACIDRPYKLYPCGTAILSTGIAIHIKNPNTAGIILPRSGLGSQHGIVLANLVGLIDSDYQGVIKVALWNRGSYEYDIQPGERIAQLVFMPITKAQFQIVDSFIATQRADGGFGSTGVD